MWNEYIDVSIIVDKYNIFINSFSIIVVLLSWFKCGKCKFIFCLCFDFDIGRGFLKVMIESYFGGVWVGGYWFLFIYIVWCGFN